MKIAKTISQDKRTKKKIDVQVHKTFCWLTIGDTILRLSLTEAARVVYCLSRGYAIMEDQKIEWDDSIREVEQRNKQ